jgi:predicted glycosyltransferase involved in capsule biosynthesis
MINLPDLTFIIPVRIESKDRHLNALATLGYLCHHLNSKIIILEDDVSPKIPAILEETKTGEMNIKYLYRNTGNSLFHRTKFLNIMLRMVTTSVVANYDIDVLLLPESYQQCYDTIKHKNQDMILPHFYGDSEYQINSKGRTKILESFDLKKLDESDAKIFITPPKKCPPCHGFCQFFNTHSYIEGGMENEEFISYGPEDVERVNRFYRLGYKVLWLDKYVWHLEHSRDINSNDSNPYYKKNWALTGRLMYEFSVDQLREYYRNKIHNE